MPNRLLVGASLLALTLAAALHVSPAAAQQEQAAAAIAAPVATADGRIMRVVEKSELVVHADKTMDVTNMKSYTILSEAAIDSAATQVSGYIENMHLLDVAEAYTLKANGKRIDVDLATIVRRDGASGLAGTYLRDYKQLVLNFPDVEVGDTLVVTRRQKVLASVFPGHIYDYDFYDRTGNMTEATVVVRAPKDMFLQVAASGEGMSQEEKTEGNERVITMRYQAPALRVAEETGAVAPGDREPRMIVSTFRNYEEMGAAYALGAAGKSRVTPAIQALADSITKDIPDRRGQAEAISHWVKKNIRYVNVTLGVGRVVPNEASEVLRNRYGDCKDHTTLMLALLAAKDIVAEPVLINSATAYTLAEPATPAVIDHVIVFLPEFGLYDDPTASTASFGVLPVSSYDKPVVHAGATGAHLERIPAIKASDHVFINRAKVKVAADGSMTGEMQNIGTGFYASTARSLTSRIQSIGLEAALERYSAQTLKTPSKGRFAVSSATNFTQPFTISATFRYLDGLKLPVDAERALPAGLPVIERPGDWMFGSRLPGRRFDFVCYAGRQIDEIEITFAEGLPLPAPMKAFADKNDLISFSVSSTLIDRTLRVTREFESNVKGQVCSAADEAAIGTFLKAVTEKLDEKMVFGAKS
jgi:hypothetical protein